MYTALITGGSRGIGLGCAQHLAAAGYAVAINGLRPDDQVEDVLASLRETGAPKTLYCRGDIGNSEDRQSIMDQVRTEFGQLHLLVNNAGVAPRERKDLLETTEESYQRLLRINCEGPFFLTQAAANWMIEQKKADPTFQGGIININSISATVASINRGEYCVSKAGLSMITQLFATRLGEFGLPVYEIRPGLIKTDMTAGVTDKYDRLIAEGLCVTPRWGLPDDIGKAVASLAAGNFLYSTGQVIMIDGGLTIPRL